MNRLSETTAAIFLLALAFVLVATIVLFTLVIAVLP